MPERRTDPPPLPELLVGLREQEEDRRRFRRRCLQTMACSIAMITLFAVGTVYGWSLSTLPRQTSVIKSHVPIKISQYEYTWITFTMISGSIFGSIACPALADRYGRKYCFLICSTMITAGWFILYATTSLEMIYFSRSIHGVGVGLGRTIYPMYVSEVADIDIRAMLIVIFTAITYSGMMITCAIEFVSSYDTSLVILIVVSFISLLLNACLPETPYFLVAKGRTTQAYRSLRFYKGIIDPNEAKTEIQDLREQTRYELHPQYRYKLVQQSRSNLLSQSRTDLPSESRTNLPLQPRTDLPSQARTDLPSQSRTGLPSQSRTGLPSQSGTGLPSSSGTGLPSQSRTGLPSQSGTGLPSPSGTYLTIQSRTDSPSQSGTGLPSSSGTGLPSQSRTGLPSQSETGLPSPSGTYLTIQSRTDSPSQSGSNLPTEPIYEEISDVIRQVDTQHMSDLQLPSTSRAPATSVVRSEVIPAVHQRPSGESILQALRALYSQSTSELQSRTRSDSSGSDDMDVIYMEGTKYAGFMKLKSILKRSNMIALFIMFGLIIAKHLGGHFAIMEYPEQLLTEHRILKDLNTAMFFVQVANILSMIYTIYKVDCVRRKILLLVSAIGTNGALIVLGNYLLIDDQMSHVIKIEIFLPIILFVHLLSFQIGLGTLPTVLLCELFPMELRGFVSAIFEIFDSIIGFGVLILLQMIVEYVGTFWISMAFTTASFLVFLMVYIRMPETKEKTYKEIKVLLDGIKLYSSNEVPVIRDSDIHTI